MFQDVILIGMVRDGSYNCGGNPLLLLVCFVFKGSIKKRFQRVGKASHKFIKLMGSPFLFEC